MEDAILTPIYKGKTYKYHECSNCKKEIYFKEEIFEPFHFEEKIKFCPFCGRQVIRYAEPRFIEEIDWSWLDEYNAIIEKMYRELEYKIHCEMDKEQIKELEDNVEKGKEYFKDGESFPYSNNITCRILYGITRKKLHYTDKQKLEKEFKTK